MRRILAISRKPSSTPRCVCEKQNPVADQAFTVRGRRVSSPSNRRAEPGGSDESHAKGALLAAPERPSADWTLLLATVLGRADVLCDVFEKQPELREPWVRSSQECVKTIERRRFGRALTAIVADIERIASVACDQRNEYVQCV